MGLVLDLKPQPRSAIGFDGDGHGVHWHSLCVECTRGIDRRSLTVAGRRYHRSPRGAARLLGILPSPWAARRSAESELSGSSSARAPSSGNTAPRILRVGPYRMTPRTSMSS